MTRLLEDSLQVKMRSHRAGRWAFNAFYARLLIEQGYQVDCSVTPRVNWQFSPETPKVTAALITSIFPIARILLMNRILRKRELCAA